MTQLAVKDNKVARVGGAALVDQFFWPIAATLLIARLYLATLCNLVPDEAFYWTWTRHLSAGYFDHPPMIAWLMWLSTRLLGNSELGVRAPASLLSVGSVAVLYWLARRLLRDSRAVGYAVLIWMAGPLLAVMSVIHTPDAPATFFSACALACAAWVIDRDDRPDLYRRVNSAMLWLLFGLFCGLAFLSKYTTILLPASVALALLTSRKGRRHLMQPWIYLAAGVALAVFSPNIYWNATHHWASFLYQIHHGTGGGLTENVHGVLRRLIARSLGLGEFVGGQAALWTPILAGIAIVLLAANWLAAIRAFLRRRFPKPFSAPLSSTRLEKIGKLHLLRETDWLLLWCGTLPLIFFGWAATRSHGEINWPAFAYFPLSLLTARYLSENWTGHRVQWIRKGCEVALGFTVAIHVIALPSLQQWILRRNVHLTHQITDLWGWRVLGRSVYLHVGDVPLVTDRHQDAGELAFYIPGQPDVWCEVGSRPTAFDYFDNDRPDYAHIAQVIFVGGHADQFMKKYGYPDKLEILDIATPSQGRNRSFRLTRVERPPNH